MPKGERARGLVTLPSSRPEAGIPDHVPAEWLPGNGTSYPWS